MKISDLKIKKTEISDEIKKANEDAKKVYDKIDDVAGELEWLSKALMPRNQID